MLGFGRSDWVLSTFLFTPFLPVLLRQNAHTLSSVVLLYG